MGRPVSLMNLERESFDLRIINYDPRNLKFDLRIFT